MPLLGLEASIGAAVFLAIAHLWTQHILATSAWDYVTSIGLEASVFTSYEVALKTGLFWLVGGLGALVFWPITLCHLLFRLLIALGRALKTRRAKSTASAT